MDGMGLESQVKNSLTHIETLNFIDYNEQQRKKRTKQKMRLWFSEVFFT